MATVNVVAATWMMTKPNRHRRRPAKVEHVDGNVVEGKAMDRADCKRPADVCSFVGRCSVWCHHFVWRTEENLAVQTCIRCKCRWWCVRICSLWARHCCQLFAMSLLLVVAVVGATLWCDDKRFLWFVDRTEKWLSSDCRERAAHTAAVVYLEFLSNMFVLIVWSVWKGAEGIIFFNWTEIILFIFIRKLFKMFSKNICWITINKIKLEMNLELKLKFKKIVILKYQMIFT